MLYQHLPLQYSSFEYSFLEWSPFAHELLDFAPHLIYRSLFFLFCVFVQITCYPGLPLRLSSEIVTRRNLTRNVRPVFLVTNLHAHFDVRRIAATFPVCPIPGQFMLLCCTGLLVVALAGAATLYPIIGIVIPVFRESESCTNHGALAESHEAQSFGRSPSVLLSQPARFALGALVLAVYTTCLLWGVFRSGALHDYFE